jgi:hypothetical protein
LVNCTLNASVKVGDLRKPSDEPFVIASRYIGNDAAGYGRTEVLEEAAGPDFDLATIAAISGAAFSPVMGRYTIPSFRLLMSLLAFRLGYWLPTPTMVTSSKRTVAPGQTVATSIPDRLSSVGYRVDGLYFLREMFGIMNVRSRFLYITDGGHTDNSGVYELLRRRCATIIAVDAGADAESLFENIVYLIEFSRVRLGTEISLSCRTVGVEGGTHCAVGEITYPPSGGRPAEFGRLIYCKLSLTGDENWDLMCRRKASGEFPYNSTVNQNYDELLFNAYRILGNHIVGRVFSGLDRVEFWNGDVRSLNADEQAALFKETL